jgi:hypothetical protein
MIAIRDIADQHLVQLGVSKVSLVEFHLPRCL